MDEQHVLFKADSIEDAQEQLKSYAEFIAEPWKNINKKWVRWQLEQILDSYETVLPGVADFGEVGAMEVFSKYRYRRRRPDDYWDGTW